jgi:hypothetical protein
MWTLVIIVLMTAAPWAGLGSGRGGGSTTMSTLDFKTKADCDAAANTLAEPGAKWGGTSAGPGFGSYKIIAKCVAR